MTNNDDFRKALELIDKSGSVLITTHTKPDGDACGCVVALCDALRRAGKRVQPLFLSVVPQWYSFMLSEKVPVLGEDFSVDDLRQGRLGQFDLIIIADADSYSQLGDFEQYLKQNNKPVLVIDHHTTSDGLGDVQLLDPTAAATGLIVLQLFDRAAWPLTEKAAQALFTAIATDTGWFQFNNTGSRVYAAAARLTDAGANPTHIYEKLYHSFSHARFELMLAMLATLELHFSGRFATQHLLLHDFERTGTTSADTENLINECHRISAIEASALFVELNDGRIRCSLRSTGRIDVSKIAEKFGGGGHKPAAGAFLPGPLQNAQQLILDEMSRQF
ncbi:MAG TPA: bifunctional oligoribonuclease/PAP phosphatase NrnA [Sedimentisphaerales bacterium]|nr:bifunctional oligoribonuclease/PAP phosphatase NrnA [Sedimentisphaerales bacterium]